MVGRGGGRGTTKCQNAREFHDKSAKKDQNQQNLLKKLKSNKVCVYDPIVKLKKKIKNCTQLNNIKSLITNSNVIVLMTPWPEFNKILQVIKLQKAKNITLIDPYRIVNFKIIKNKHFKYFTIGR